MPSRTDGFAAHECAAEEFADYRRDDPGQNQEHGTDPVVDKRKHTQRHESDKHIQGQGGGALSQTQMRRAGILSVIVITPFQENGAVGSRRLLYAGGDVRPDGQT